MATVDTWLWVFRGGIFLILLSALLFMLGFSTDHWHDDDVVHYGLWQRCEGVQCSAHEANDLQAYHVATQALQIVTLFCFVMGPVIHFFFYLCKKHKDTGWRSRIFDLMYTIGTICLVVSIVVFGMEHSDSTHLSWSYRMSASAAPLSVAGIILVIMSRSKALSKFRFLSTRKRTRKSKVSALVDSRSSTPRSYNSRRSANSVILEKQVYHPNKGMTSSRDGAPQINVHVNITNPSSSSGAPFITQSSQVPYAAPYGNHPQPFSSTSDTAVVGYYTSGAPSDPSNPPPEPPYTYANSIDSSHQQDPSLTKVRPAPMPSHLPHGESASQPRRTFGPSNKHRELNPSEKHDFGPIQEIPSAPPSDSPECVSDISADSGPPPYSDAVGGHDAPSSFGANQHHTSEV